MLQFTPFPILMTQRLVLRQLEIDDENEIFILRSDERILKFINIPKAKNLEDARAYITMISKLIAENVSILWGMTLRENSEKIIGTICLWNFSKELNRAEIGYVLHPDFQGKGIMQEAAEKVIDYGFNILQLDTIEADLHPNNLKSINLLKRNNFTFLKVEEPLVIYSLAKGEAILR